jgi:hypothetical protein
VFAQVRTHGLLSQVAVSERVTSEDDYWLPDDILDKLEKYFIETEEDNSDNLYNKFYFELYNILGYRNDEPLKDILKDLANIFLNKFTVPEVQALLKELGYKHEIYSRWPNHMKFKTWIMGGYLNNPKQWGHFLLERSAYENVLKNWTQEQTKQTAKALRKLIKQYNERKEKDV